MRFAAPGRAGLPAVRTPARKPAAGAAAAPGHLVALPGGRPVAPAAGRPARARPALGPDLVHRGVVSAAGMMQALVQGHGRRVSLPRLLRSLGLADDRALAGALAGREAAELIDPATGQRPDPRLIDRLGAPVCVRMACLPWRRAGALTLVATADPEGFESHRPALEARLGPVAPVVIAENDLHRALAAARRQALRRAAETSVAADESCRTWNGPRRARQTALMLGGLALLALWQPIAVGLALLGALLAILLLSTGLRLAAAVAAVLARDGRNPAQGLRPEPGADANLPVISIMVPLFREPEIAPRLVGRLGALDYPRDLLDVLLVVEADDQLTRDALEAARLPGWMRVVAVPEAPLRTKPRALNYALNFARGQVVGVYDAEDAPDRDQLRIIAAAFALGGPDLACVQGVLDYYNPETNWMARCFTIEYAAWFRLVLTGFARLGLVVPLGGTTLFFRRAALEELGGWDAWNVTEDADLGVRLTRRGYRTELVHTVTMEEANCRVLPWIKQRSRWLKGYAMTYAVHMRRPGLLWRELGAWRFFGYQVLFLGTLAQFLLAPVFWTLWLLVLGLDLPLARAVPGWAGPATLGVLLACELVAIGINLMALDAPRHRRLRPWVVTMGFYFPLATAAAYKAVWEMLTRPFYWDKTTHGVDDHGHRPLHGLS